MSEVRSIMRMVTRIESRLPELDAKVKKMNTEVNQLLSVISLCERIIYANPILLAIMGMIVAGELVVSAATPGATTTATQMTSEGRITSQVTQPVSQEAKP